MKSESILSVVTSLTSDSVQLPSDHRPDYVSKWRLLSPATSLYISRYSQDWLDLSVWPVSPNFQQMQVSDHHISQPRNSSTFDMFWDVFRTIPIRNIFIDTINNDKVQNQIQPSLIFFDVNDNRQLFRWWRMTAVIW